MNKTIYVMALRSELPTSSLDGCDIHTKLNQRNTPNLRNASSVPALESSNNEGWTLLGPPHGTHPSHPGALFSSTA